MTVEIVTLGCRLNIAESEAIRARAEEAGLDEVAIVNSCAVTAEATRQARQAIRRLKRQQPDRAIVVTGCAAQVEPERFSSMAEVSLVLGNAEKAAADTWTALKRSNSLASGSVASRVAVADIMTTGAAAAAVAPPLFREHTRAFVQAQNGCDHRCTFCIIPFGRGNSRSAPVETVVRQVRSHVEAGVREVVLTGVDIASYGRDLPETPALGALVRAILRETPELARLRLSSLDPVAIDDELRRALAEEARLMPHLHLSLQHGDDLMLKRMKRRHARADVLALAAELRALRPGLVFGADIIAGFPTEDEAAFARSLDLVEQAGLTWLHVFPYSPRPGTPAARMPQLPSGLVKERAARLRALGEAGATAHLTALVGRNVGVLTERGDTGRTECFAPVRFLSPTPPGELLTAAIRSRNGDRLVAA